MSNNPDTPTVGFFAKWTVVSAALLGIFLVIVTSLVLGFKPAWLQMERDAFKQSHQYTEAKESMLLQLVAQYDELEVEALLAEENGQERVASGIRGQQKSILSRIKSEAQRVDPDELPPSVRDFLEKHP